MYLNLKEERQTFELFKYRIYKVLLLSAMLQALSRYAFKCRVRAYKIYNIHSAPLKRSGIKSLFLNIREENNTFSYTLDVGASGSDTLFVKFESVASCIPLSGIPINFD